MNKPYKLIEVKIEYSPDSTFSVLKQDKMDLEQFFELGFCTTS